MLIAATPAIIIAPSRPNVTVQRVFGLRVAALAISG